MIKNIFLSVLVVLSVLVGFSILTDNTEVREIRQFQTNDQTLEGFKKLVVSTDDTVSKNSIIKRIVDSTIKTMSQFSDVWAVLSDPNRVGKNSGLGSWNAKVFADTNNNSFIHKSQEEYVMEVGDERLKNLYKDWREQLKETKYPNMPIACQDNSCLPSSYKRLYINGLEWAHCPFYAGVYIIYVCKEVSITPHEYMYLSMRYLGHNWYGPQLVIPRLQSANFEFVKGIAFKQDHRTSVRPLKEIPNFKEKLKAFLDKGNSCFVIYTGPGNGGANRLRQLTYDKHWLVIVDYEKGTDNFYVVSGQINWGKIKRPFNAPTGVHNTGALDELIGPSYYFTNDKNKLDDM